MGFNDNVMHRLPICHMMVLQSSVPDRPGGPHDGTVTSSVVDMYNAVMQRCRFSRKATKEFPPLFADQGKGTAKCTPEQEDPIKRCGKAAG